MQGGAVHDAQIHDHEQQEFTLDFLLLAALCLLGPKTTTWLHLFCEDTGALKVNAALQRLLLRELICYAGSTSTGSGRTLCATPTGHQLLARRRKLSFTPPPPPPAPDVPTD